MFPNQGLFRVTMVDVDSLGENHKEFIKNNKLQKQPPRGVLKKRCSENMQQIYRRTPMSKCPLSNQIWPVVTCVHVDYKNMRHILKYEEIRLPHEEIRLHEERRLTHEIVFVLILYFIGRGSHSQMCFKIDVLRNFAIIKGEPLCWSLFFNKVAGLKDCFCEQLFYCRTPLVAASA